MREMPRKVFGSGGKIKNWGKRLDKRGGGREGRAGNERVGIKEREGRRVRGNNNMTYLHVIECRSVRLNDFESLSSFENR